MLNTSFRCYLGESPPKGPLDELSGRLEQANLHPLANCKSPPTSIGVTWRPPLYARSHEGDRAIEVVCWWRVNVDWRAPMRVSCWHYPERTGGRGFVAPSLDIFLLFSEGQHHRPTLTRPPRPQCLAYPFAGRPFP